MAKLAAAAPDPPNSIQQIPVASLVEDWSVYPRHAVDDAHVASLALAMKAGAEFPPIVVERLADGLPGRIVDGWHRVRAARRVVGPEAVIAAELRTYANEADLVVDAVALNATHGRRMDRIDQVRAVWLLDEHGVTAQRIAAVLEVPPERVVKLQLRTAEMPAGVANGGSIPGTRRIALKPGARHLVGQTLTEDQARAHVSAPGVSYLLLARQLKEAMESKLLDDHDEKLMQELRRLAGVLGTYLRERRV
jgi:hypothetical protein